MNGLAAENLELKERVAELEKTAFPMQRLVEVINTEPQNQNELRALAKQMKDTSLEIVRLANQALKKQRD